MTKRILVPGGAGYIGSHCCKALAEAGHEPIVYDNLSTGHRDFVRWGELVEGDIGDADTLKATIARLKPDGVMHFAALALVGPSMTDPGSYWRVNVGGTLNLLEAMRAGGVPALVFSSTCAIYGEPATVPIAEDAARAPVNPYGATKLACERMMDDFDLAHGIRSVRLRYFNAAGADREHRIGERHDPETHLIPLVMDAALGRRPDVRIFGTDYPTPDGTAVRDYIHVEDLAAAHLAAMKHLLDGGATDAFNLGTGRGASVAEIVRTVEDVSGMHVPTVEAPRRAGDPPALVADPSRAESVLGWRADRSLERTIADAWEWHRRMNR